MRTLVKICGLTCPDDARCCHAAGADLLGVILTDSPRRLAPGAAAAVRAAVPGARLVGVFGGETVAEIARVAREVGLDLVQLHGCGDPWRWRAVVEACGLPVLPAVTTGGAAIAAAAIAAAPDLPVAALLLDLPKQAGPAPRAGLWLAARHCAEAGVRVLLAGALAVDDVGAALRDVQPHGLDVCRGVESAPGRKDPELVRRFVAAVRNLEASHGAI